MESEKKKIGEMAVKLGYIPNGKLSEALEKQELEAKKGMRRPLGHILLEMGLLTPKQVRKILGLQTVLKPGQTVGDFKIISTLGIGSAGRVYKAKQRSVGREVALKVLLPSLAEKSRFQENFFKEARAVAKLNHPHIVAGFDVGCVKGVYYFAMEYIEGESLRQRLDRKGALEENEALEFIRQIALALEHAHRSGFLHRDVKPGNILVNPLGEAKLTDLGLVRSAQEEEEEESRSAVGTPYYMSPEQAKAKAELTPSTDLYSLGATLFHLLTGRPPFTSSSAKEILKKHVFEKAPDPRSLNPGVSGKAAEICLKLLKKEPRERPGSAQELAVEIEGVLLERKAKQVSSSRVIPIRSVKRSERSSRTRMGVTRVSRFRIRKATRGAGAILIGAIIIVAILFFLLSRPGHSPALPQEPLPAPEKTPVQEKIPTQEKIPARQARPAVTQPQKPPKPIPKTPKKPETGNLNDPVDLP